MKINKIVYLVSAALILVALFFIFKPQSSKPTSEQNLTQTQIVNTPSSTPQTNIKTFELVISKKKITSGQSTLTVQEDDQVTLKITSDEPEEFHIHAYDNFVDLKANTPQELTFTASLTGRFPFELELSKTELGTLEVLPK